MPTGGLMHELSIAIGIVEAACEEAAKLGGHKVHAVHLRLGKLSGVVPEALLTSYDMASADTPLGGSRLVIEEVPVEVYCTTCNALRTLGSIQWFSCAECGTPPPDVRHGKELEVVALEVET